MAQKRKHVIQIPKNRSARSAFIRGMTRITNPKGNIRVVRVQLGNFQTDADALRSDWVVVGDEIKISIHKYGKSLRLQHER